MVASARRGFRLAVATIWDAVEDINPRFEEIEDLAVRMEAIEELANRVAAIEENHNYSAYPPGSFFIDDDAIEEKD